MQKKYAYGSIALILLSLFLMLESLMLSSEKANANSITIKSDFGSGLSSWAAVDSDPFPTAGFASGYDSANGLPTSMTINNYLNFYKGTLGSLRFAATGDDVRGSRYYTQTVTLDQPRPSARLSFAYKKKWAGSKAPLAQNLFVAIKQPSGKVVLVWQERGLSQANSWKKVENLDVGAYFFAAGNYEIRIGSLLDNGIGGTGMLSEAWFDEVYFDLRQNNTTRPTFAGGSVLTATPFSKGQIDLSWPQADPDPEGIQEYRVFINGHKRPAAIIAANSQTGPTYSYSVTKDEDGNDLKPITLYQFTVRAVDKDGNYSDPLIESATTSEDDGTPATLAAPTNNPLANNIILNSNFATNSKNWTLVNDYSTRRTAGFTTAWDPVGFIGTVADYTYKNGEAAANLIPMNGKGGSFSAYARGGRSNRGGRYVGQDFTINNTTGPFYLSLQYMKAYNGTAPSRMILEAYITRPGGTRVLLPVAATNTTTGWGDIVVNQTGYKTISKYQISSTYIPAGVTGTYKLEFRLRIQNSSTTNWSTISIDEVMLYSPDITSPSTPTGITGKAITDTRVDLSWKPSTDNVQVSKYNVYRSTSSTGPFTTPLAVISTLGQVTYTDNTVVGNTTYYYRIEAVDPRGNKSAQSSNFTITTPQQDLVPPVKVPNVRVIGTTSSEADVFWDLTTDPGFGVVKYEIYRANDNNGSPGVYDKIGEADNTTTIFKNTGLTAKRTYWYYVIAYDRTNNQSPMSDQVSVYIQPSPHGNYGGRNAYNEYNEWRCANCHRGHKGQDTRLLVKPTQPKLCLTCHDSYGSQYVLKPDLQALGGSNVFHPIKDTEAQLGDKVKGIIKCTDCHNPHGDKKSDGTLYPRWLRSKSETVNGTFTYTYEGNQYCLNCHGEKKRTDLVDPVPDPDLPKVDPAITDPVIRQQIAESITYWDRTSGNHDSETQGLYINPDIPGDPGKPYVVSGSPVMHFDITKTKLIPGSGTKITCVQCHDEHSSPNYRLTIAKEEGLCFKCHNDTATSASKTSNILDQFNRGGSRHNIYDDDQEDKGDGNGPTKVECISCHGPHAVSNKLAVEGATTAPDMNSTVVSDPFNTKRQWNDNIVSFCLNCHGDQTKLPVEKNDGATAVPYTINMPDKTITTNVSGWDKRSFIQTDPSHWTAGVKSCRQCHEQHGSAYQRLTKYKEDDMGNPIGDANGEGICFQCHKKTGYPSFLTSTPPDIKSAFLGPGTPDMNRSGHTTLLDNGKHNDTESYKNMPLDQRHAECYDCHDMHSSNGNSRPAANKASGTQQSVTDQDVPPKAPGALRNIQGLGFTMGTYGFRGIRSTNTTSFANWMQTSLSPDDSKFVWKSTGITYMFELCYKCHSSYSFGVPALDTVTGSPTINTWQDSGPDEMTDVAREFNPENPAFHPVEAYGRTPNGTYVGTDSFGDAWGPNKMMYCTDCHGAEDTTPALPKGPHGSVNPRILKGPWSSSTNQSSTGALCFRCHSQSLYNGGISSITTNGFKIDANPGTYTANTTTPYTGYKSGYRMGSTNLHREHLGGGKANAACQYCHAAIPHGFYRRHLIVYSSDASPYNQGAARLSSYTPRDSGYSKGDCSNNCGH